MEKEYSFRYFDSLVSSKALLPNVHAEVLNISEEEGSAEEGSISDDGTVSVDGRADESSSLEEKASLETAEEESGSAEDASLEIAEVASGSEEKTDVCEEGSEGTSAHPSKEIAEKRKRNLPVLFIISPNHFSVHRFFFVILAKRKQIINDLKAVDGFFIFIVYFVPFFGGIDNLWYADHKKRDGSRKKPDEDQSESGHHDA